MTRKSIATVIVMLAACVEISVAQVAGSNGTERSPADIARSAALFSAQRTADQLLKEKRWQEAVLAYQEVIRIEKTDPDHRVHYSGGHLGLARANMGLDRILDAVEAYRVATYWSSRHKDVPGGIVALLYIEYALALLQANRLEDAKAIYYAVLRTSPSAHSRVHPFLVVFESEPGMTVWPLTKPRLESALLMLQGKGYLSEKEWIARLDRIQAAAPEWILPALYRPGISHLDKLDQVYQMAATEEERGWIDRWRQYWRAKPEPTTEAGLVAWIDWDQVQRPALWEFFESTAKQRLKNSTVLEAARVAMEKDPLKLVGRIVD